MKKIINLDPLGFTEQTKMLLCGLGANNLINEFKARNISTDTLHQLTKEDFMKLGATEDCAEHLVNKLSISKKKNYNTKTKFFKWIHDSEEILKLGKQQLTIIQAHMIYYRLRLKNEKTNFFVDQDKALSASHILCIAADATLKEVKEAELRLKELETFIITPKRSLTYSYILCCISIGIFGVTTYKLLTNK